MNSTTSGMFVHGNHPICANSDEICVIFATVLLANIVTFTGGVMEVNILLVVEFID